MIIEPNSILYTFSAIFFSIYHEPDISLVIEF
jgi:hypothetical protein